MSMEVLPANRIIANVFNGCIISSGHLPGPASYDAHGNRYVFAKETYEHNVSYAIDVELRDEPVPAYLSKLLCKQSSEDIMRFWTELEVIAKLKNIPCHILLLSVVEAGQPKNVSLCSGIDIIRCDSELIWVAAGRYRAIDSMDICSKTANLK
jgi:hypothetical protein